MDGKPVVDADKPVTVHITTEDCAKGSKKDPENCAVALALRRITDAMRAASTWVAPICASATNGSVTQRPLHSRPKSFRSTEAAASIQAIFGCTQCRQRCASNRPIRSGVRSARDPRPMQLRQRRLNRRRVNARSSIA